MNVNDPDPKLQSILAKGVNVVIAHGVEAGHDRARIARDVADAFNAAVGAAADSDGGLDSEVANEAEGEAMSAGTADYPPRMMARVMAISLAETGLDLRDLMAQESAWAAIQVLMQAQLPPA